MIDLKYVMARLGGEGVSGNGSKGIGRGKITCFFSLEVGKSGSVGQTVH